MVKVTGDKKTYLPLLLDADPCEAMIDRYLEESDMFVLEKDGKVIGEAVVDGKGEIKNLAVLPEYQGKGYGSRLMDLLETRVFENYSKAHVDASFPAESMYLKRGYQIISYEKIATENGDFLCYHTMEKRAGQECLKKREI